MVISSTTNLTQFFQNIRSLGFFGRLFSWNKVLQQAAGAVNEINTLVTELNDVSDKLSNAENQVQSLQKDINYLKDSHSNLKIQYQSVSSNHDRISAELKDREKRLSAVEESEIKNTKRILDLENEKALKEHEIERLNSDITDKEKKLSGLKESEINRQTQYEHKITELNSLKQQLDDDRKKIQQEREAEIQNKFERMKETWREHEKVVELALKSICSRHQIEYIDKEKVPFKGKPDNTLTIFDQFIIFDAKSPASDDLNNFPSYLRNQAEAVKKYVKEDDVHKEVFLVVPSNTVDAITQFYYNMADYDVFVTTIDALEPIILTLRRIEDYEFAEQLNPEERDNICRIIGKFAHATKRRIQIDSYFCNEFINLLNCCYALPEEFQTRAIEFEKADKMNPPQERRAKQISLGPLTKEIEKNQKQLEAHEIESSIKPELIDKVPLYKEKDE